jgi:C4-dicarboxylate-specific signal transduction histidine kinase
VISVLEWRARLAELSDQSTRLHAEASQRVNQHDAHLTALSAIAVAGAQQRPDLFQEVAGAVMRFYPRITGVFLVPIDASAASLESGTRDVDLRPLIRDAVARSSGAPVLVRAQSKPSSYIIVKRSPNTKAARYGLALVIDAAALLGEDRAYWAKAGVMRRLMLPDGTALFDDGPQTQPQFTADLSSGTQPLRLETAITLGVSDILPPDRIILALVVITLGALALRALVRQRARIQAAEKRAELRGLETRLSHASRVNALGEMASGMAHELTQPLTAILAQTQAARHLAARRKTDQLVGVLDEVVGQTRRASAILDRLRNWTRPQEHQPGSVDLRDCVAVAKTLLAAEAAQIGAQLEAHVPTTSVPVLADRVELEQVLFNLLKNALDAVADVDGFRTVVINLTVRDGRALIDVTDTGPGLHPDIRERLFTPFATTRETGTGLGLALSLRLVERANGDLFLVESTGGAHFRVSLPLLDQGKENT